MVSFQNLMSLSCSLIQHCSSLGDLHVVRFVNCMLSWKHANVLGFLAWPLLVSLAEFDRKSAESMTVMLVHVCLSVWCHGCELGWLLGSGLCG